jgi:hypothetical protein
MVRGARPKVYPPELVEQVSRLYASGLTQEEVAARIGTTQKVVWKLMLRHGIQARPRIKRDQRGPKNAAWGHSSVTYAAYHKRVEAEKGRPRVCEQCGTTSAKAYDWACMGRYDRVADYKRLCRSCHWRADGRIRNIQRKEVARELEAANCR